MNRRAVSRSHLGHALTIGVLLALGLWISSVQVEAIGPPAMQLSRWAWASACVVAYLLASGWLYRRSVRGEQRAGRDGTAAKADVDAASSAADGRAIGVIYASQTGFAHELAERTRSMLQAAGLPAYTQSLGTIHADHLGDGSPLLFIVSTTGEGDAPDDAVAFTRSVMTGAPDLSRLRFGLLALGDSDYDRFCGFGRELDAWLMRHGARPLFDAVEVDDGDDAALRHWHHHVAVFAGRTDLPDWQVPRYLTWRLDRRTLLNPGSEGGSCFLVSLTPPDASACDWRAGDLVEIGPRNDPAVVSQWLAALRDHPSSGVDASDTDDHRRDALSCSALPELPGTEATTIPLLSDRLTRLPHREYSIASLPSDGRIELIVRQMRRPDGQLGIGSGWLTEHAPIGGQVSALVRRNAGFHPPAESRPMILIGNGTGLAGLRAHLKARIAAGSRRNWLVFGERHADRDFLLKDELLDWQASGWIQRLDLAFSRDQSEKVYVQDRLRAHATELRRWIDDDAALYVCGSLAGMAPGVHSVLAGIVGDDRLADLAAAGRYRRDVY